MSTRSIRAQIDSTRSDIEGGNMSITRSISVAQIDNRFEAK